jgi:hypothetical protein
MSTHRTVHNDKPIESALSESEDGLVEGACDFVEHGDPHPRAASPVELPELGTESFGTLNRRRAELIRKDVSRKLEGPEREELEQLERLCGAAVDHAFPLPPVDLDSLIQLRDSLRAEKQGRRT